MNPLLPWIDQLSSISERLGPGLSSDLASYPLPPLHRVHQRFPRPLIEDVDAAVVQQLARPEVRSRITPGARICVAVGSRGIARISTIVRALIRELKALGANPFIIPAMGSHGGATPEGQVRVLADYNITPETMDAPIVSSLDTLQVGTVLGEVPVFCSVDAARADAIIVVGRVKPHTGFRGPVESGLMKMLTIGLGKQHGADTLHAHGMDRFAELIPAAARVIVETQPLIFGLAIVENGYDEPARIEAVLPAVLEEREKQLLDEARVLMPSLPFKKIDVLVIQAIGKNISGSSLDPNVCGRFVRSNGPQYQDDPQVQRIAMLDLTPETHGNAAGIGLGDVMTLRMLQKLDLPSTYANCLTASHLEGALLPVVMESDRACIATAAKVCVRVKPEALKLVVIRNTLEIGEIWISPALLQEARSQSHLDIDPTAVPMAFDGDGSIVSPVVCIDK
jgi:hypothetical protein